MAALMYDIDIACKGNPGDMREMWLAVSRPKEGNTEERQFILRKFSPHTGKDPGAFVSADSVIDIDAHLNSIRGEKSKINPETFYPVLAKAFPRLSFFIVQRVSADGAWSCAAFEAKNGRMRISGRWKYDTGEACCARLAWIYALQGHWLLREDETGGAAPPSGEPVGAAPQPDDRDAAEKRSLKESLAAVQADGDALEFVQKQTEKICLAAVENKGRALRFVHNQSLKICRAAVKQDGLALEFVREKTRDLCLAAVKQNYLAYRYVRETSPSLFRLFDQLSRNALG
ncbi:MAG: DUF4116 domain-containing protein [Spirochaetales bacterium]|jgi:hypothetical protein|nr:DUF4116 domain-containing protein [Spirochaetales bacterium]